MTKYKTTIECDIYTCKYNSACCSQPSEEVINNGTFCTRDNIKVNIDDLSGTINCSYEEDYKKLGKCFACQIAENGEVDFEDDSINEFEIIEVNSDNDDGLW